MSDEILRNGELEKLTAFMINRIVINMLGNILDREDTKFNDNFKSLVKLGLKEEVIYVMLMIKGLDIKNETNIYETISEGGGFE